MEDLELTADEKKAMEQMAKGEEVTLPDASEVSEDKTDLVFDPKNLAAVEELEKFQKKYGKFEYVTKQEGRLIINAIAETARDLNSSIDESSKIMLEALREVTNDISEIEKSNSERIKELIKISVALFNRIQQTENDLQLLFDRTNGSGVIKKIVRDKKGRPTFSVDIPMSNEAIAEEIRKLEQQEEEEEEK